MTSLAAQPHRSGESRPARMKSGTVVEVRNRFDGAWGVGFEVIAWESSGYLLRRRRDGAVLPGHFAPTEVRPGTPGAW